MSKTYQNQSGFTVVEGLLVVLVLALVGFGGYYVWRTQHDSSKQLPPLVTTNTQKTSQTQPTTAYLDIKEWGVKLPLTSEFSDTVYCFQPAKDLGGGMSDGPYVYFAAQSLGGTSLQSDGQCGNSVAALSRYKLGDTVAVGGNNVRFTSEMAKTATKVGDYYYLIESSHARFSTDDTLNQKADSLESYLAAAYRQLVQD